MCARTFFLDSWKRHIILKNVPENIPKNIFKMSARVRKIANRGLQTISHISPTICARLDSSPRFDTTVAANSEAGFYHPSSAKQMLENFPARRKTRPNWARNFQRGALARSRPRRNRRAALTHRCPRTSLNAINAITTISPGHNASAARVPGFSYVDPAISADPH